MSRIGYKPITLPEKVEIKQEGQVVNVKGPKGELSIVLPENISMNVDSGNITLDRAKNDGKTKALHGTARANVANMIEGVSGGFEKHLELVGVGYRAQLQGDKLTVFVGYSHPVEFNSNDDIKLAAPDANHIDISGINKQKVGDFAAEIRSIRPPEPYKGKGIRYVGEHVRRKEGKTGK